MPTKLATAMRLRDGASGVLMGCSGDGAAGPWVAGDPRSRWTPAAKLNAVGFRPARPGRRWRRGSGSRSDAAATSRVAPATQADYTYVIFKRR